MFLPRTISVVVSTMPSTVLYVVICLIFGTRVSAVFEDYYWRDFNGTIPKDAIVGGQSFGHNVYIGQAYIRNEGIFPVTINPGVKEVAVPIGGVRRVDKYIKILCGNEEHFEWVPSNSTTLHVDLLENRPVLGGQDDNRGYLYIGRINIDGGTLIGKVNTFNIGDAQIRYPEKTLEKTAKEYEVLCFVDFGFDFDIRVGQNMPPQNQTM